MDYQTMNIDDEQLKHLGTVMLGLIPSDGTRIGNITLRDQFLNHARTKPGFEDITDEDYWFVRNDLIDRGLIEKGRGKGGSVRLLPKDAAPGASEGKATEPETLAALAAGRELDLYEPLHDTLTSYWVKEVGIKYFVSSITAQQGRRFTGGKWTRPDISLVAVRVYPFIPGRSVEVITFEVKPKDYFGVDGAYEAAAFTAFAQRSYLAVHISEEPEDNSDYDRLRQECERFGIGLITFTDPADAATLEEVVSPRLHSPEPAETSRFINRQIPAEQKQELHELIH